METPIQNGSECFDLGLFLQGYYETVFKSPESADEYYKDTSVMARPGTNGDLTSVKTVQAIKDMILSLDFENYCVEIKSTDSQESYEGGLVILVHGNLTGRKDHMQKKFAHLFFLAPQDKGFCIVNDILRYVNKNGSLEPQSFPTTINGTVGSPAADNITSEAEPTLVSEHTVASPSSSVNRKSLDCGVEANYCVKNDEGSVVSVKAVTQSDTEMAASNATKDFSKKSSSANITSRNTEEQQIGSVAAAPGPEVPAPISSNSTAAGESHAKDIPMQYLHHAVAVGSSVDMPMPFEHHAATLKADSVGSNFVQAYYHNLYTAPEKVLKFYEGTSMLVRPDTDGAAKSVPFQIATKKMIFPWDLKESDVELKSSDAQESYEGGMMLLVTGCLIRKGQKEKSFVQSFFLAPRGNGYFVFADVFRYVDDKESLSQQSIPAMVSSIADSIASEPDMKKRITPFHILYYQLFCQSPDKVQEFYKDTCVVTRPDKFGTMRTVTTKQAINDIILSLDSEYCDAKLALSFIPSHYHGGWMLLVSGFLIRRQDQMQKPFAQSFFIAPRDGCKGTYDVINDICRYFHEKPYLLQSSPLAFNVTVESSVSDNSTSGSESTEVSWHSPDPTQVFGKLHVSRVRSWRYKWCKVVDPNDKRIQQVASGISGLDSTPIPLKQTLPNCCCKRKSNKPIRKWRHICCPSAAYVSANKEDSSSLNTEPHEVDSGQPAPVPEASTPISNNSTATSDSPDEVERHSIFIPKLPMGTSVAEVEEEMKKFGSIKPGGVQVTSITNTICSRCGGVQVTTATDKGYCFGFVEFEALSSMNNALEEMAVTIGGEEALIYLKSPQLLELEAVIIGGVSGEERLTPYRRSARDGNFHVHGGGWEEVSSEEDEDEAISEYREEG